MGRQGDDEATRVRPEGYGGMVVAADDRVDALEAAIATALTSLDALRSVAQASGPAWIAGEQSYERYLDGLVQASAGR